MPNGLLVVTGCLHAQRAQRRLQLVHTPARGVEALQCLLLRCAHLLRPFLRLHQLPCRIPLESGAGLLSLHTEPPLTPALVAMRVSARPSLRVARISLLDLKRSSERRQSPRERRGGSDGHQTDARATCTFAPTQHIIQ